MHEPVGNSSNYATCPFGWNISASVSDIHRQKTARGPLERRAEIDTLERAGDIPTEKYSLSRIQSLYDRGDERHR